MILSFLEAWYTEKNKIVIAKNGKFVGWHRRQNLSAVGLSIYWTARCISDCVNATGNNIADIADTYRQCSLLWEFHFLFINIFTVLLFPKQVNGNFGTIESSHIDFKRAFVEEFPIFLTYYIISDVKKNVFFVFFFFCFLCFF